MSEQGWPSAIDLLYCYTQTPYTKDSGSVPLVFSHQLSKLVFIITPTEGVDIDLTDAGSELIGLPTTAKFALADGSLYDLGGTATPSSPLIPIKNTELSTSEKIVFEAIVIPNKGSDYPLSSGNPRCFYFTAGGTDYTYTFPDSRDMEKGTAHSYNFTLTTTELILTQTSIIDWNNDASDLLLPPSLNKYTVSEPVPAIFELSDAVCTETFIITTNSPEETATVKYSTTGNPNRATDLPDWLTVTPTYTDNGETNARTWTMTTNIGRNLSAEKRTFYIHVTIDGYEKTVQISQNSIGQANCYIVSPGDQLHIPISRIAEFSASADGVEHPVLEEGEEFYPAYYWKDGINVLDTTEPVGTIGTGPNGSLVVNVGTEEGNAVVGVQKKMADGSFVTLWSWHIWVTDEAPTATTYTNNGYTFMDRNLGATTAAKGSVGALGLFYQWGRKDPFLGASSTTANISATGYTSDGTFTGIASLAMYYYANDYSTNYSITHPMAFFSWTYHSNEVDWFNGTNPDDRWRGQNGREKTIYDPCPAGWRVPASDAYRGLDNNSFPMDYTYKGRYSETMGWWPNAGCQRENCTPDYVQINEVSSTGFYWTSNPGYSPYSIVLISSDDGAGWNVAETYAMSRNRGCSVRCVSE